MVLLLFVFAALSYDVGLRAVASCSRRIERGHLHRYQEVHDLLKRRALGGVLRPTAAHEVLQRRWRSVRDLGPKMLRAHFEHHLNHKEERRRCEPHAWPRAKKDKEGDDDEAEPETGACRGEGPSA